MRNIAGALADTPENLRYWLQEPQAVGPGTRKGIAVLGMLLSILLLTACSTLLFPSYSRVEGGDVDRGRQALQAYGCGSCHVIPGVPGAVSYIGPPLDAWADRHYIAGALINTPENLILWLREPQTVEPGTAMPNMGVTEEDARDMSAYLYRLRRDTLQK